MREPRRLTPLWPSTSCYRDIFTLFSFFCCYYYYYYSSASDDYGDCEDGDNDDDGDGYEDYDNYGDDDGVRYLTTLSDPTLCAV
jgi:hypothetical protein